MGLITTLFLHIDLKTLLPKKISRSEDLTEPKIIGKNKKIKTASPVV